MGGLTNYVQPLTTWLMNHPNLALFITFLISLSESLAIIGSIVPGSLTMTAIGILAGSGIMRIDLTFIAATLGAVAGDGASYALGYILSDRLPAIWPFSRYPHWINYGKAYFERHGGKSVLIGRFVGPLRSIIPVIAGMLRMHRWHFFIANFISAIGWSLLYILPGILIGAASTELSAETATRLIVIILMLLATIWLVTYGVRWIFMRIKTWGRLQLHALWKWSCKHPMMARFLAYFNPETIEHCERTLLFMLIVVGLSVATIILSVFVIRNNDHVMAFNQSLSYFLQSFRTHAFDTFFTVFHYSFTAITLSVMLLLCLVHAFQKHNLRLAICWLSVVMFGLIIHSSLNIYVKLPPLTSFIIHPHAPIYPATHLMIFTALWGLLLLLAHRHLHTTFFHGLSIFIVMILVMAGLSDIYLGQEWAISVLGSYSFGVVLSLAHWLWYRRKPMPGSSFTEKLFYVLITVLVLIISIQYQSNQQHLQKKNYSQTTPYFLSYDDWWHQNQPLMPFYTTNRLGQRISSFNIQYAGSLRKLIEALSAYGWEKQPNSLFTSLLMRVAGQDINKEFLSMTQLYLYRTPALTMSYQEKNSQGIYVLRLWRSNYQLLNEGKPIWVGSMIYASDNNLTDRSKKPIFTHVLPALDGFNYTSVRLTGKNFQRLPMPIPSQLLIVQEQDNSSKYP